MPAPTTTTTASPTIAAIDRMIEIAEEQVRSLTVQQGDRGGLAPGTVKGTRGEPMVDDEIEQLDAVISKLTNIREWLTADPRLVPLVDDYIGKQARAVARRQSWQNLMQNGVFAIIGAVLGWLAGLFGSPQSLFHLFGH